MNFLPEAIQAYADAHTSPEPPLLAQLNRETHLKVLYPRMLSGHIQGRMLALFAQMLRPRRILEIGTYTGYSAICLAEGLTADGHLHTIEIDEEREAQIMPYIHAAGLADKVSVHFGDAREIIPTLNEAWDLVFLDADKQHYVAYFDMVFPNMRSGAVLLADNVLWSGRIVEEHSTDKELVGLRAFNDHVLRQPDAECVLLPIRDGIMAVRKR